MNRVLPSAEEMMGRGGLLLGEAMVLLVEVTMEEAAKQAVVQRVGVEAWVKEVVASVEA